MKTSKPSHRTRFILRRLESCAPEEPTVDPIAMIQRAHGRVLDAAPGMLLFKGTQPMAARLAKQMPGWQLDPETFVPLASTSTERACACQQDPTGVGDPCSADDL